MKNKDIVNVLPLVAHIFKNYTSFLYLSGYTYVFGKISELIHTPLDNNYIMATKDYQFSGISQCFSREYTISSF